MTFLRPPAGDDPDWPRASTWLDGTASRAPATAPLLRVVGVPCSIGSISPSEAWQTPPDVRAALARLSTWDPVSHLELLEEVRVEDVGDWPVSDLDLVPAIDRIHDLALNLPRDAVHMFLGGDNAITRPVVTGLHGPDLSRVGLITLDAHHDVRHLEEGPRNGSPIRGLLLDGLPGRNVAQIGIGRFTNSGIHAAWCHEQGIRVITAPDVHTHGIALSVHEALAHLTNVDVIHVDFDVDVLDVTYASACPGARPGGLHPEQLYEAAALLGAEPRVASADLVEVDTTRDIDGRTVMATAMTLLSFATGLATRPTTA